MLNSHIPVIHPLFSFSLIFILFPLLSACSEQHKPVQSTELRRTASLQVEKPLSPTQNFDQTRRTFKVLRNNNEDYGDESYQIKTDAGTLSIYSMNLNPQQGQLLSSVKFGECLTLSSQSDNLIAVDGYISVMELGDIKIHPCK
ncbi:MULTISPECIES: hypothetical protein [unclassified Acinetobacter]|uniref:hypothetical protein n=1 Tax=unclassified Acinetobacter TaxID=196816 RepID=UPI0015D355BD|nr:MULTISPECIES: hypothetical protein [unclassified Acinetobacter]QOW50010.1 hypothetical protein G0029_09570 [Acinetobacter sp. YH12138]